MGGLLSKAPIHTSLTSEYADLLEHLNQQIEKNENERNTTRSRHKYIIRTLIFYSFATYALIAAIAYVYQPGHQLSNRIMKVAPLILFPIIVYAIKQAIDWWYIRKIDALERQLESLDKEKQDKLEELVKKSDFLETQKLLMKHKTPRNKDGTPATPATKVPTGPAASPMTPAPTQKSNIPQSQQKVSFQTPQRVNNPTSIPSTAPSIKQAPIVPPIGLMKSGIPHAAVPPMINTVADARPLSRVDVTTPVQRGALDKVVDFVLGDGPNNRFALICAQCATHNGLAREEDINIRYRCPFCGFINGTQPPAVSRAQRAVLSPSPQFQLQSQSQSQAQAQAQAQAQTKAQAAAPQTGNVTNATLDSTSTSTLASSTTPSTYAQVAASTPEETTESTTTATTTAPSSTCTSSSTESSPLTTPRDKPSTAVAAARNNSDVVKKDETKS